MFKLVGKQEIRYTNKKGELVQGVRLHCTYADEKNIAGIGTENFYYSSKADNYEDVLMIPLNSEIVVSYNRYGHIQSIVTVKK